MAQPKPGDCMVFAGYQIHIEHKPYMADSLIIIRRGDHLYKLVAGEKYEPGSYCRGEDLQALPDEVMGLGEQFIQAFIDAAYDAGFRPAELKMRDRSMAAHLEDMRAIVFAKVLKKDPPA